MPSDRSISPSSSPARCAKANQWRRATVATAKAIRAEIDKRIDQGQTNEQITTFLIGAYNESISLKPRATGVVGLVWITPVVAFVTAVAGLIVVFRRWHLAEVAEATDADRLLVERARSKLAAKARP